MEGVIMMISETLYLGFDSSTEKDVSALAVSRVMGSKIEVLRVFTGTEAEEIYERLTGIKMEEGPSVMLVNQENALPLLWNHDNNVEVIGKATVTEIDDGVVVNVDSYYPESFLTQARSNDLKVLRKALGYSQTQMAHAIGVSRYTIINMEKGNHIKASTVQYYRDTLEILKKEKDNENRN